jgi:hypothetical protein
MVHTRLDVSIYVKASGFSVENQLERGRNGSQEAVEAIEVYQVRCGGGFDRRKGAEKKRNLDPDTH